MPPWFKLDLINIEAIVETVQAGRKGQTVPADPDRKADTV